MRRRPNRNSPVSTNAPLPDRGNGWPAIDQAYRTMRRGTQFLGNRGWGQSPAQGTPGSARLLGNGLRELDRFLNILVCAVGEACGIPVSGRERNTANTLARVQIGLGMADHDGARLRAMKRSRNCLFYRSGLVDRGDRAGDAAMTAGWPAARPHRFALGATMTITSDELAEVCDFYMDITDGLLANMRSSASDRSV